MECGGLKRSKEDIGVTPQSHYIDESDSNEDEDEYGEGGYCPVSIGQIFNNKYKVISKLGWGNFSTVWEVCDIHDESKLFALKIIKSDESYAAAAEDEIAMLKVLSEKAKNVDSYCLRLIEDFKIESSNGSHICMVFEKMGSNLLSLIKLYRYKGIPIPLVKVITKQVLIALDFMNSCQLIHTDLKPENVLLYQKINKLYDSPFDIQLPPWDPDESFNEEPPSKIAKQDSTDSKPQKVKIPEPVRRKGLKVSLVDFGNATWYSKHFTDDVQTRQYRAPEVILGKKWDEKIDIWSLGCMVFELITGHFLFKPIQSALHPKDHDHVALFVKILGPFSLSFLEDCTNANTYFNDKGHLKYYKQQEIKPQDISGLLMTKYSFSEDDSNEITEFLLPMLTYDPNKRASAKEMLQHPWLADVSFPWDSEKKD